jgi:general secretion pathway protein G
MFKSKKGFTLIELLIVIVIIGILATVVIGIVGVNGQRKARDTKKKADIHEIQNALENYFTDKDNYPATAAIDSELVPNYLKASLADMSAKSGNKTYTYTATGDPASAYTLQVELENQNDSGPDVVTVNGVKYFQVTSKQ